MIFTVLSIFNYPPRDLIVKTEANSRYVIDVFIRKIRKIYIK